MRAAVYDELAQQIFKLYKNLKKLCVQVHTNLKKMK